MTPEGVRLERSSISLSVTEGVSPSRSRGCGYWCSLCGRIQCRGEFSLARAAAAHILHHILPYTLPVFATFEVQRPVYDSAIFPTCVRQPAGNYHSRLRALRGDVSFLPRHLPVIAIRSRGSGRRCWRSHIRGRCLPVRPTSATQEACGRSLGNVQEKRKNPDEGGRVGCGPCSRAYGRGARGQDAVKWAPALCIGCLTSIQPLQFGLGNHIL
ncbi:hypothetical protein GGR56DRAFT_518152 [Xylariaceae sp. FL0804]|nr:hypothetical protein GGR56DRAFT_518152 [Xylariaceae sp. FL0804]